MLPIYLEFPKGHGYALHVVLFSCHCCMSTVVSFPFALCCRPLPLCQCNRFVYNFDVFQHEKLNTRFEFPRLLDLEPFTKEGLAWRQAKAAAAAASATASSASSDGTSAGAGESKSDEPSAPSAATPAAPGGPGDTGPTAAATPEPHSAATQQSSENEDSSGGDGAVCGPYTVHPQEYYMYRLKVNHLVAGLHRLLEGSLRRQHRLCVPVCPFPDA